MNDKELWTVMNIIITGMSNFDFTWRFDGSGNLRVQGVKVSVNDVDIVTDENGLEIFRKELNAFVVRDFYNKKKKAWSLILNINKQEVEINYYDSVDIDLFKGMKEISWQNLKLKVLPFIQSAKYYKLVGKQGTHDLILKYVK